MNSMSKIDYLEKVCGLKPSMNHTSEVKKSPKNTKKLRSFFSQSRSEPIITVRKLKELRSNSQPCGSSNESFANVEVALTELFQNSDHCMKRLSRSDKQKKHTDEDCSPASVDEHLLKVLDSTDEDPESPDSSMSRYKSNVKSCKQQQELSSNTDLQWGNTYPIESPKILKKKQINEKAVDFSTSKENNPDELRQSQVHSDHSYSSNSPVQEYPKANQSDSDGEKNSQSQEICRTENDFCRNSNTQEVWADIFEKNVPRICRKDSNKSNPEDSSITQKKAPETRCETPAENLNAVEILETVTQPKSSSTRSPNNFSDEELLQYFCYHSFELVDFRDDKVWHQFGLNKNFTEDAVKFYKDRFLNCIVKSADSYHIPSYFSTHLNENYNKENSASVSNRLSSKSPNLGSTSRRHSRYSDNKPPKKRMCTQSKGRNNFPSHLFSSDEEDNVFTNHIQIICCKSDKSNSSVNLNKQKNIESDDSEGKINRLRSKPFAKSKTQTNNNKDETNEKRKYFDSSDTDVSFTSPGKVNRSDSKSTQALNNRGERFKLCSRNKTASENNVGETREKCSRVKSRVLSDGSDTDVSFTSLGKVNRSENKSNHGTSLNKKKKNSASPSQDNGEQMQSKLFVKDKTPSETGDSGTNEKLPKSTNNSSKEYPRIYSDSSDTDASFTSPNKVNWSENKSRSETSPTTSNKSRSETLATPERSSTNCTIQTLAASTSKSKRPMKFSQSKGLFLRYEKENMLKYIQSKSAWLDSIKGNVFWKEMEAANAVPGRTWQSLKNHFFRSLLFELGLYNLNPRFEQKLIRYTRRIKR